MKSDLEKLGGCKRKLNIAIPKDVVEKDYQTVLRKFGNSVTVPGFRKGKASITMVENAYKEQIKASYLDEYAPKYYKQAIQKLQEEKIFPVNQGVLGDLDWKSGKELKISFLFEVHPSIKLEKYKNFTVDFKQEKVTQNMIENELKKLQENYAKIIEKDSSAENQDLIYYKMEKYGDEQLKEKKESSYRIGDKVFGEKFDKAVLSAKIGDMINTVVEIPISKSGEKPEMKNVVLKICSVKKIELPELNDEFAKEVGDYKTLNDLKNEIRKSLQNQIKVKNQREKNSLILQEIIEKNTFEVPEFLIDDYVNRMINQSQNKNSSMSKDTFQKMKEIYSKYAESELKKHYIFDKLREIEKVEVTDEEIEDAIKKSAESMNMDVEKYKKLYQKQIDKESIKITLSNEKILKNIESTVKFVEKK